MEFHRNLLEQHYVNLVSKASITKIDSSLLSYMRGLPRSLSSDSSLSSSPPMDDKNGEEKKMGFSFV